MDFLFIQLSSKKFYSIDEKAAENCKTTGWTDPTTIKSTDPEIACKKCSGAVFDLEKFYAKCGMYHKMCFKCDTCCKRLDNLSSKTQYVETETNELLCQKCFEEKYGANGTPNVYAETAKIVSVDGQGCPRCGGAVFHAEEIIESGRCYHRQCFNCKSCKRNLGQDRLNAMIGFDKEVYCSTCGPKAELAVDQTDTTKIKGDSNESQISIA